MHKIAGSTLLIFYLNFLLTKLPAVWYNKNSRAADGARASKSNKKQSLFSVVCFCGICTYLLDFRLKRPTHAMVVTLFFILTAGNLAINLVAFSGAPVCRFPTFGAPCVGILTKFI